uniref:GOLD domain-containing protein n=1 Tax=Parascaris equorum TaxID=6256 RepID=A0A914RDT6_PAREQ
MLRGPHGHRKDHGKLEEAKDTIYLPVNFVIAALTIPDGAEKIQIPPRQVAFICRRAKKGDVINFWVHSDGTFASGIYCTQNENEVDLEKMYPAYPSFAWIAAPLHVPLMQSFTAKKTGIYKFWYTNEREKLRSIEIICMKYVIATPMNHNKGQLERS